MNISVMPLLQRWMMAGHEPQQIVIYLQGASAARSGVGIKPEGHGRFKHIALLWRLQKESPDALRCIPNHRFTFTAIYAMRFNGIDKKCEVPSMKKAVNMQFVLQISIFVANPGTILALLSDTSPRSG